MDIRLYGKVCVHIEGALCHRAKIPGHGTRPCRIVEEATEFPRLVWGPPERAGRSDIVAAGDALHGRPATQDPGFQLTLYS